ncbi:hypothetical protein COMNV_01290 [Commensalibacter sp. Nvir]|uniref:Hint domain-containing protein n=1 Tax=Commensalibacter sp. Nvir TaxID=3069817 RepID=UPI002D6CCB57|nr:hypothetical protein COMNV_01290 [Commensalibacter sp. Nvir]
MTTYVTPSGVTYDITKNFFQSTSKVTIKGPDGTSLFIGNVNNSNIITPTSTSSITITSLASRSVYIVAPTVTNGLITVAANISSLTDTSFYIGGTATLNILATSINTLYLNIEGGNLTLTSRGVLSAASDNRFRIDYGGSLTINPSILNVLTNTTVTFYAGGGSFIANCDNSSVNLSGVTFSNYDPTINVIELNNNDAISKYTIADSGSSKTVTLYDSSGKVISNFTLGLAYGVDLPNGDYSLDGSTANPLSISYSNGDNFIGACFLAGSMIHTPTGTVPVETLKPHDTVISYINGNEEVQPIIWVGSKEVTVRPDYPDDQAGYPICILKDAIADNLPSKNMWITAEHCLFFNGKFVPARMLVNNTSIFYDYSITAYTYYHIKTQNHSVIKADGMLTESYLDTGNRVGFDQKNTAVPVSIHNRHLTWEHDAAAPLDTTKEFVEPIFFSILARTQNLLENKKTYTPYEITQENDFHLITDTGTVLYPTSVKNQLYAFALPAHTTSVRLVSRASRPFDTIGPFVDDRRCLGLLIGKILLQQPNKTVEISNHLENKNLPGWHAIEGNTHRWTDGNALLSLDSFTITNTPLLLIQVNSRHSYIASEKQNKRYA